MMDGFSLMIEEYAIFQKKFCLGEGPYGLLLEERLKEGRVEERLKDVPQHQHLLPRLPLLRLQPLLQHVGHLAP